MSYAYYLKRFWPLYLVAALICIAAALGTDRAVTTIADQVPIERKLTIVIDAGHGGEDGGAISCTGVPESQINLQIALRLEDLCHLLGYRTRMIRREDVSVYTEGNSIAQRKASDLKQRVRMVTETENALVISIHQNIFPDGRYSGAQVFYNSKDASKALADYMQADLVRALNPGSNRKSKKAENVYLMKHISCTAVLVECGFLSNREEEAKLRSANFQQRICCVIVSSVSRYLHA